MATVIQNFDNHYGIDPETGCWIWTAARSSAGYGQVFVDGHVLYAHRVAYERATCQVVPVELEVCHRCDNPPCVNPDHLFVGTHADNFRDAAEKGRMEGLRGERSPMAKLTERDVLSIRSDRRSHRQIAADYGISNRHVSSIKRREVWSHI